MFECFYHDHCIITGHFFQNKTTYTKLKWNETNKSYSRPIYGVGMLLTGILFAVITGYDGYSVNCIVCITMKPVRL